jgi:hypothetical protein
MYSTKRVGNPSNNNNNDNNNKLLLQRLTNTQIEDHNSRYDDIKQTHLPKWLW